MMSKIIGVVPGIADVPEVRFGQEALQRFASIAMTIFFYEKDDFVGRRRTCVDGHVSVVD